MSTDYQSNQQEEAVEAIEHVRLVAAANRAASQRRGQAKVIRQIADHRAETR